jgi:hypothetical protein
VVGQKLDQRRGWLEGYDFAFASGPAGGSQRHPTLMCSDIEEDVARMKTVDDPT